MAGATRHSARGRQAGSLLIFCLLFMVRAACAEVIVVQGQLTDELGQAWDGLTPIEFSIYDDPAGGSKLWTEAQQVEVLDGLFSATLGAVIPFSEGLFATSDRWLAMDVDGAGEQAVRFRLSTSPMTIHANVVESLPPGSFDGSQLEHGALTPGKLEPCNTGEFVVMGADGWVCESPGDQQ